MRIKFPPLCEQNAFHGVLGDLLIHFANRHAAKCSKLINSGNESECKLNLGEQPCAWKQADQTALVCSSAASGSGCGG